MHAVQQGFFPALTLDLINYMLKYYAKDDALDEGRTTGFVVSYLPIYPTIAPYTFDCVCYECMLKYRVRYGI